MQQAPIRRVGIVGFAGGTVPPLAAPVERDLFNQMVDRAREIIAETFGLPIASTGLVSGGAPWSDHVAVALFLRGDAAGLRIWAPASWDGLSGRYVDNGTGRSWRTNPGMWLNTLHERFRASSGIESFSELLSAVADGATIDDSRPGFHARNTAIAESVDYLIAFSWSDSSAPIDGGTRDTWEKAKARLPSTRMVHVSMRDVSRRLSDAAAASKKRSSASEKHSSPKRKAEEPV
jgi:hypothetical protein